MKQLQKGDRIRLKVGTIGGWKGTATVLEHSVCDDTVEFLKDGYTPDEYGRSYCYAFRHEVSKIRMLK